MYTDKWLIMWVCRRTTISQSPPPLCPRLDHPRDNHYGCRNPLHSICKELCRPVHSFCKNSSLCILPQVHPHLISSTTAWGAGGTTLDWQPFLRPAITLKIRERGMRRSVTLISHDHIVDSLYMWNQCANGRGSISLSRVLLWKVPSEVRVGSGLSFSEHTQYREIIRPPQWYVAVIVQNECM